MKFKLSLLSLSLVAVLSGASQVLANQNSSSKTCTSTSTTGRSSCTSTSSSQSVPSSNEQPNLPTSQGEQMAPSMRSVVESDDFSSSSDGQSNPNNSSNISPSTGDRPINSSQEQSNPSSRLDRQSNPSGIENSPNTSIIENERSAPASSKRTNGGENSTPTSSDRTNGSENSTPASSNRTNGGEDESPASSNRINGGGNSTPTSSDRTNGGESSAPTSSERSADSESVIEQEVHEQISKYRAQQGLPELTLNESISKEARMHSENMASGAVAFSHDGFGQRVKALSQEVSTRGAAENVAYNGGYGDPATKAVEGWIDSPGHRQNIEGNYNLTGIGVAKNAKGEYYFTQIFIRGSNTQQ